MRILDDVLAHNELNGSFFVVCTRLPLTTWGRQIGHTPHHPASTPPSHHHTFRAHSLLQYPPPSLPSLIIIIIMASGSTATPLEFPHTLTVTLPLPTPRVATILADSLSVDEELSPFVHRTFETNGSDLVIKYAATTARMLRVSTNGVFESVKTLLETAKELDLEELEKGE